jgi:protein-disulfide isomerase
MKSFKILAPLAVVACSLAIPAMAADTASAPAAPNDDVATLKTEVSTLKAQLAAMQKEIQQLKVLIMVWKPANAPNPLNDSAQPNPSAQPQATNPAPMPSIRLMEKKFKGDKDAKLTIVDFSDYQCPFCGRFYRETLPQIEKDYIDTGKVRYVIIDHPLASHVYAPAASQAAHCADDQGKFWEMSDSLFADQSALNRNDLNVRAKALGLDVDQFNRCMDSDKYGPEVTMDLALSKNINIHSVPSFLIGFTDPKSDILKAEKIIEGAQPYAVFKATLDDLLKAKGETAISQR